MPQLVDLLKALHVLDILLVGIILGFAFLGFTRGALKVFIILASIYIGFVVASIYYLPVGNLVQNTFNLHLNRVAEIIAFFLLNALIAVLLAVLLFQFFGHIEVRGRAGACVDRPVGMILGFFTGILLTSILVILLAEPYRLFQDLQLGNEAPFLTLFNDWYKNSALAPMLVAAKDPLLNSVAPLLGGRKPLILVGPTGATLIPAWLALLFGPRG